MYPSQGQTVSDFISEKWSNIRRKPKQADRNHWAWYLKEINRKLNFTEASAKTTKRILTKTYSKTKKSFFPPNPCDSIVAASPTINLVPHCLRRISNSHRMCLFLSLPDPQPSPFRVVPPGLCSMHFSDPHNQRPGLFEQQRFFS